MICQAGEKGCGLFCLEPLKSGQFIIEYVGEVLDEDKCNERLNQYRDSPHFYLLTLTSHSTIDATQKGNLSRFINHSCAPNAATQKWESRGRPCVGIFAKRDIPAGSEITFDYQYERFGAQKQPCYCGAPNCAKFLGESHSCCEPRPFCSSIDSSIFASSVSLLCSYRRSSASG